MFASLGIGFSYNLQRPYPFKHFTPAISVLLVALFVFFSVYNIATNGFDLQPFYTSDPNATEAQRYWFLSPIFTWGDDKLHPTCQPKEQAVGSQFTTTNLGYLYTLSSLQHLASGPPDQIKPHSSISYLNNTLRDCRVNEVQVHLEQATDRAKTDFWVWENSYMIANAYCEVVNQDGLFGMHFTTSYNMPYQLYGFPPNQNYTSHASIWWGIQKLSNNWFGLLTLMGRDQESIYNGRTPVISGFLQFVANETDNSASNDIESPHALRLRQYNFVTSEGFITHDGVDNLTLAQRYNNVSFRYSRPLTEALSLSRAFYSLIQIDLGQTNRSNQFTNESSIRSAYAEASNFNRWPSGPLTNTTGSEWQRYNSVSLPGHKPVPMNESYNAFSNLTGKLGTEPAYIVSQYLCSVPSRKSFATIFWTTVVANFVLLSAAKTIIMFFAEMAVQKRDPLAMYCDGCIAHGGHPPDPDAQVAQRVDTAKSVAVTVAPVLNSARSSFGPALPLRGISGGSFMPVSRSTSNTSSRDTYTLLPRRSDDEP